eukprot:12089181-Prorocentrum_lima.AAC.1
MVSRIGGMDACSCPGSVFGEKWGKGMVADSCPGGVVGAKCIGCNAGPVNGCAGAVCPEVSI